MPQNSDNTWLGQIKNIIMEDILGKEASQKASIVNFNFYKRVAVLAIYGNLQDTSRSIQGDLDSAQSKKQKAKSKKQKVKSKK